MVSDSLNQPLGNKEVVYFHTPSMTARTAYFYIQMIGHFHRFPNYFIAREGLRSFLFIYTINGKGSLLFRDKSYEMEKDSVMLINLEEYHKYSTISKEEWEFKWFHFNGCGSQGYFNVIYDNFGPVINLRNGNNIIEHINRIAQLLLDNDVQFEIKASRIIFDILNDVLLYSSNVQLNSGSDSTHVYKLVEKVQEFIRNNYNEKLDIKKMAGIACLSQYHFSRLFKKVTGYAPYEYLINYRINIAKTLLKYNDFSIAEIAEKVGFESESNFIKKFREIEGTTPLKYRNRVV